MCNSPFTELENGWASWGGKMIDSVSDMGELSFLCNSQDVSYTVGYIHIYKSKAYEKSDLKIEGHVI